MSALEWIALSMALVLTTCIVCVTIWLRKLTRDEICGECFHADDHLAGRGCTHVGCTCQMDWSKRGQPC